MLQIRFSNLHNSGVEENEELMAKRVFLSFCQFPALGHASAAVAALKRRGGCRVGAFCA